MRNNKFPAVSAGGAIVLVICVVVCLAIFGALSVSTAYADLRLTDRLEATLTDYYDADAQAQRAIAVLDKALFEADRADLDAFFDDVAFQALALSSPRVDVSQEEDGLLLSFSLIVDQGSELYVELACPLSPAAGRYEVRAYQTLRTDEEDYGQGTIEVWDGDFE